MARSERETLKADTKGCWNRKFVPPKKLYYGARYYDTATGEFISQDPLEYVDGMSQYRAYFVPGAMDPLGLAFWGFDFDAFVEHVIGIIKTAFFDTDLDDLSKGWGLNLNVTSYDQCCCKGVPGLKSRILIGGQYSNAYGAVTLSGGGQACMPLEPELGPTGKVKLDFPCFEACVAASVEWSIPGTILANSTRGSSGRVAAWLFSYLGDITISLQCGACGNNFNDLWNDFGCSICVFVSDFAVYGWKVLSDYGRRI